MRSVRKTLLNKNTRDDPDYSSWFLFFYLTTSLPHNLSTNATAPFMRFNLSMPAFIQSNVGEYTEGAALR